MSSKMFECIWKMSRKYPDITWFGTKIDVRNFWLSGIYPKNYVQNLDHPEFVLRIMSGIFGYPEIVLKIVSENCLEFWSIQNLTLKLCLKIVQNSWSPKICLEIISENCLEFLLSKICLECLNLLFKFGLFGICTVCKPQLTCALLHF